MVSKNQNKKQMPKENTKKVNQKKVVNQPKKQENRVQTPKNKKMADEKSASVKKVKSPRKILTWTILIAMLVGITVFLCRSEMFNVCNIEIVGNRQVSQKTILELSQIKTNKNIFLSRTNKAKNNISENPYIKEVSVKRILPDKIKIEVVEKEKAYMLQGDGKVAYIDKNGDILEISENKLENLIMIQGYLTPKAEIEAGKKLNEEDIQRLEDIQAILKSSEKIEIQNQIETINIENKNDYILYLPTYKKIVYIGDTSNLSNKMLYMKAILEEAIDKEGKIFLNGNFNKGFDPYFREEINN